VRENGPSKPSSSGCGVTRPQTTSPGAARSADSHPGAGTQSSSVKATRGAAAALVLALSPWWAFNAALGNSEGLLAAAVLWAAVAHVAGRPGLAFAALLAGSLLRPEVWPFLGLCGLALARGDRGARLPVAAGFAAVALLWIVPGRLGGGSAAGAALGTPSEGSAALADVPFLAVLGDAAELLTIPAALAALLALGDRDGRRLGLAAGAYVLLVAAMTQAGFAGNPRYLVPAAAIGAALAGAGAVRAAARAPAAGAAVLVAAVALLGAGELGRQLSEVEIRAATREDLAALPRTACRRVRTSTGQRSAVAYELGLPLSGGLDARPSPPAAVYQARPYSGGDPQPEVGPPFEPVAAAGRWVLQEAGCPAESEAPGGTERRAGVG